MRYSGTLAIYMPCAAATYVGMTDAHYQFLKGSHNVTDEHESIELPWRAFVTAGTRTAKVATVRTDGRPHIAPVAFVLDGDDLVFVTALDSVKGRTLRRTGVASATVDEETPHYPFVIVEGTVTTTEQPADLRRFASAIALRYVGAENVEALTERNAVPGQFWSGLRRTESSPASMANPDKHSLTPVRNGP
jgi:PPOX class probable F420-dependent enzyme